MLPCVSSRVSEELVSWRYPTYTYIAQKRRKSNIFRLQRDLIGYFLLASDHQIDMLWEQRVAGSNPVSPTNYAHIRR